MSDERRTDPGQKWRPSSRLVNVMTEATRDFRARRLGREGGEGFDAPLDEGLLVMVRNDSGAFAEPGYVLAVTGQLLDPVELPAELLGRPLFSGDAPAATTDPVVVLRDGLEGGAIGVAVMVGLAVVSLDVSDASHGYAVPTAGDASEMQSSATPGYRILDRVGTQVTRTVSDAVTNGTTTLTSATAAFVAADVGAEISGTNIPGETTIASVTNGTTIVMSAAATGSGSGGALTIEGEQTAVILLVPFAATGGGTTLSSARVMLHSGQAVATVDGGTIRVPFSNVDPASGAWEWDTGGYFDPFNPTLLLAPQDGEYEASAGVTFQTSSGGAAMAGQLRIDFADVAPHVAMQDVFIPASTFSPAHVTASAPVRLQAGTGVFATFFVSGGNTVVVVPEATFLGLRFLGTASATTAGNAGSGILRASLMPHPLESSGAVSSLTSGAVALTAGHLLLVQVAVIGTGAAAATCTAQIGGPSTNSMTLDNSKALPGGATDAAKVFQFSIAVPSTSSAWTITVTPSASFHVYLSAVAVKGLANNVADKTHSASGTSTTPDTGATATTTVDDEYAQAVFLLENPAAVWTWGSPFLTGGQDVTDAPVSATVALSEGYEVLFSTDTPDATLSAVSAPGWWAGMVTTYK